MGFCFIYLGGGGCLSCYCFVLLLLLPTMFMLRSFTRIKLSPLYIVYYQNILGLKVLQNCIYSLLHSQGLPWHLTFHGTFPPGLPALSFHSSPIGPWAKCRLPLGEMPFTLWQEDTGWSLECYQMCVCEPLLKTFGHGSGIPGGRLGFTSTKHWRRCTNNAGLGHQAFPWLFLTTYSGTY